MGIGQLSDAQLAALADARKRMEEFEEKVGPSVTALRNQVDDFNRIAPNVEAAIERVRRLNDNVGPSIRAAFRIPALVTTESLILDELRAIRRDAMVPRPLSIAADRSPIVNLDDTVLAFVADWDEGLTGHGEIYAHDIADQIREEVGKVARALERLAKAYKIEAQSITTFGSVYPEYMVTGISSFGRSEVDRRRATPSLAEGRVTINVSGVVGTLNTGQVIGNIESNVQAAIGPSAREFGEAVAKIVESVADDSYLEPDSKKETIENFEALSEAARLPATERKLGPIKAILSELGSTLTLAVEARAAWDAWGPAVLKFFGV